MKTLEEKLRKIQKISAHMKSGSALKINHLTTEVIDELLAPPTTSDEVSEVINKFKDCIEKMHNPRIAYEDNCLWSGGSHSDKTRITLKDLQTLIRKAKQPSQCSYLAEALEKLSKIGHTGMPNDFKKWVTSHDLIAEIADKALAPYRKNGGA